MSLTFDTGKKLLKEIVGGTGFHNYGVTTYLALCYDQPYYEAKAGTYNVNEPTALGYSRVQLPSDYFGNEIILPGGGTAYINVIPEVEKLLSKLSEDEKIGR